MKCQRCQCEISEEESHTYLGEILCDDCYIDVRAPAKSCDPWAVYLATRSRESTGHKGAEGLSSLQHAILAFIKEKGKVTPQEVMTKFNISQPDLQNQMATLRHCELVKGHKEGGKIYLVHF